MNLLHTLEVRREKGYQVSLLPVKCVHRHGSIPRDLWLAHGISKIQCNRRSDLSVRQIHQRICSIRYR